MKTTVLTYSVVCLTLLAGCNDKPNGEAGLSPFSSLNSDGNILAVLVGSRAGGRDRPAAEDTKPVLLMLDDKSLLKGYRQLDDWVIRDLAWRPAHHNQLYYVSFGRIFGDGGDLYEQASGRWFKLGPGKLVMFDASSNVTTIISQDGYPNILSCFRWSPDGTILAGLAISDTSQLLNSGKLAVSFDGGKTCEATDIEMSGYPAWSNDNELYLTTTDLQTIVRVLRDGHDFRIVEKLTRDFRVGLMGSFHGKPVYNAAPRKGPQGELLDRSSRLFAGDQLIYETNDPYLNAYIFTDRIVVEADDTVMIFDENLSLRHERHLNRKTHLLNFQPNTNVVFLIKNWETILCYDYTKDEPARVLFSIDQLRDCSKLEK